MELQPDGCLAVSERLIAESAASRRGEDRGCRSEPRSLRDAIGRPVTASRMSAAVVVGKIG